MIFRAAYSISFNAITLSRQAIREEDRRRNKISDAISSDGQDELTIYLRQPCVVGSQIPATRRFSKLGKRGADEERVSDKVEIDSDNIETPPATRRLFSPPKEVKPVEKEPCKRERCSSSLQNRETKTATLLRPVGVSADLGTGERTRWKEVYLNKNLSWRPPIKNRECKNGTFVSSLRGLKHDRRTKSYNLNDQN